MAAHSSLLETVEFDDPALANQLFGPHNAHLDLLAAASGAHIGNRGDSIFIESPDQDVRQSLCNVFVQLYDLLRGGLGLSQQGMARAYEMLRADPGLNLGQVFRDAVFVNTPPAVAMALSMLQPPRVKRLLLTRPAVEAGERLGFLPGDLAEKVNPYLRPLYDALHDMMPQPKVASMLETGSIEVAPLAFMRGRTLNDAFIILDEAQNTTQEQMKMFLTRMGFGSRMAVTGDTTQIDLPPQPRGLRPRSGLIPALDLLHNVSGLAIHHFSKADVVRHPLVGAIVSAYDHAEKDGASG